MKLEEKDYGYISGRVSSEFIKASIECGVDESKFKSLSLMKSYESCIDKKQFCYWNDFVRLVECAQIDQGGPESLIKIGHTMTNRVLEMPAMLWLSKFFTLRSACKILFKRPVNFLNVIPVTKVYSDRVESEATFIHKDDECYLPVSNLLKGIVESLPIVLGYEKMKSATFTIDPIERKLNWVAYFPKRRSLMKTIKNSLRIFNISNTKLEVVETHNNDIIQLEEKNSKKLKALHDLIDNILDPVLIVKEDLITLQNRAFNTLTGHKNVISWSEHFSSPEKVKLLISDQNINSIETHLKRDDLPNIPVSVHLTSVTKNDVSAQAILRVNDISLPDDPYQIATMAQEKERQNLARDIHDSLGQLLSATSFQLASLNLTEKDIERSQKIAQISKMVREITLYSRKFTRQLDLLIDECKSIYEVVELVKDEFATISGVKVRNKMQKGFRIQHSEGIRHIGYILQEAMNNAYRHGKATEITVSTKLSEHTDLWIVEDNGCGMQNSNTEPSISGGIGLRSIEYRVNRIGGLLNITTGENNGVKLVCEFRSSD